MTINTHCHLTTYKQDFSEAMGALYENNSRRHEAFLSRRDFMSVAWQFTAWNDAKEKPISWRRYDFVRCGIRSPSYGREQNVEPRSYRTLTGRNAFSNCFQAVNCQDFGELGRAAMFIESLRDKVLRVLCGLLYGR
jgi:hypothetical protein